MQRIVVDTNVLVAALRSRRGASFALLRDMGKTWIPLISAPLILEYEAVGLREANHLSARSVETAVLAFCSLGEPVRAYFKVRPSVADPGDEFLVELAVAGKADAIVTHNLRHLAEAGQFGIRVVTPGLFLRTMKREQI